MSTVVFFHAHPDDEAIFTGGTIARLTDAGIRVAVVFATRGELGEPAPGTPAAGSLAQRREEETEAAAAILGVSAVHYLGYLDSGMTGNASTRRPGAFASVPLAEAADALADLLVREGATDLVTYDSGGVYGHPDHIKVHEVGSQAAALAQCRSLYEATVDREYLHFVETHLVVEAGVPGARGAPVRGLGLAGTNLGTPTVLIDCTVDVQGVLDRKRRAMAAHASQIPETSSALGLEIPDFAGVYGVEWYVRRGAPGAIDPLACEVIRRS